MVTPHESGEPTHDELSEDELDGVSGGVKKDAAPAPPPKPSPPALPPDKKRDIAHDM